MLFRIDVVIILILSFINYLIYRAVILNVLDSDEKSEHLLFQVRSFCDFITYCKRVKEEKRNPIWIIIHSLLIVIELIMIAHLFFFVW